MAINFSVGDYVIPNTAFIDKVLSFEPSSPMLSQTLSSLGYLKEVSQVAATGTLAFPVIPYIRLVPVSVTSPIYNAGQGISIYFSTETLLNNSFELSTAFIPDVTSIRVLNNSGSIITAGAVVRQSGFDTANQVPTIALASAAATSTAVVLGITQNDIADGSFGAILTQGSYGNIDTSSFSAIGDNVFLSDTAGQIAVTAGTTSVIIGKVLSLDTSGALSLLASITGGVGGSGGSTPGLDEVLAAGANSGANDLIMDAGQAVVIGGATTSGVRLEANSGTLELREGDDSGIGKIKGLFVTSADTNDDTYIGGGDPDSFFFNIAGSQAFLMYPDAFTAAPNGTVDLGFDGRYWRNGFINNIIMVDNTTSGIKQRVSGGNLEIREGDDSTYANLFAGEIRTVDGIIILGQADTSGVRLEVNSGRLDVREGDDSAPAGMGMSSLAVSTITNLDATSTINVSASSNLSLGAGNLVLLLTGGTVRWHVVGNGAGNRQNSWSPFADSAYDLGTPELYVRTAFIDHIINQIQAVSGTTTLTATGPEIIECTVASSYTVTLPTVASCTPGRRFVFKDNGSASGSNVLTIDGNSAETIDGSATQSISTAFGSITIFLNAAGTAWLIESIKT